MLHLKPGPPAPLDAKNFSAADDFCPSPRAVELFHVQLGQKSGSQKLAPPLNSTSRSEWAAGRPVALSRLQARRSSPLQLLLQLDAMLTQSFINLLT